MRHTPLQIEFYKEMALKNLLHANWIPQEDGHHEESGHGSKYISCSPE